MTRDKSHKPEAIRIIIAGPTGVGKSDLANELARLLQIPVISADSRQCYRYMDIGTGKISPEDLKNVPHYNISILDPDETDNASLFRERCLKWEKIISREHPIILYEGGSTLYLESLLHPFDELPPADPDNVMLLQRQADEEGISTLYEKLKKIDPDYVRHMDGINPQRIIRALDVYEQTGLPFSRLHTGRTLKPPHGTIVFVLNRNRETLHERINNRVDSMMRCGLTNEVRSLLERGYNPELNALQTVGYREIISYMKDEITLDRAVDLIKRNTRRYARRQLTWFRRWEGVTWIDMDKTGFMVQIRQILDNLKTVAANEIIP